MPVTTETAVSALAAALAVARAEGRPVRSMRDLLCDACGEGVALRPDGLCCRCDDERREHYDATAADHCMSLAELDAMRDPADGAEYLAAQYDDAEAAAGLAGIETAKF